MNQARTTAASWYKVDQKREIVFPTGWLFAYGSLREAARQWSTHKIRLETYQYLVFLSEIRETITHVSPFSILERIDAGRENQPETKLIDNLSNVGSLRKRSVNGGVLSANEKKWFQYYNGNTIFDHLKNMEPSFSLFSHLE